MDKGYIAPDTAIKKLRGARSLKQTVHIYGATGYGKTELVKQYLKNFRYRYISCGEDTAALTALVEDAPERMPKSENETENGSRTVVVLDDLRLQAERKSYGQIAEELSIKEATVKYHAKENYRKLGVSGKADAVLAARNLGILYEFRRN